MIKNLSVYASNGLWVFKCAIKGMSKTVVIVKVDREYELGNSHIAEFRLNRNALETGKVVERRILMPETPGTTGSFKRPVYAHFKFFTSRVEATKAIMSKDLNEEFKYVIRDLDFVGDRIDAIKANGGNVPDITALREIVAELEAYRQLNQAIDWSGKNQTIRSFEL